MGVPAVVCCGDAVVLVLIGNSCLQLSNGYHCKDDILNSSRYLLRCGFHQELEVIINRKLGSQSTDYFEGRWRF
jgi:hypothetical protein